MEVTRKNGNWNREKRGLMKDLLRTEHNTISNATNSKQVLDIASAVETDYANIQMYASNNTSAQRFELYYVGNGYYQILSEKSGKSLDVANGSKKQGANVWQYSWNGIRSTTLEDYRGGRRWILFTVETGNISFH